MSHTVERSLEPALDAVPMRDVVPMREVVGQVVSGAASDVSEAASQALARVKPRLRGVSHEIAFYCSIFAVAALVYRAHGGPLFVGTAVYGTSLVAMFGVSALYHRPMWSPSARLFMRRLDHATIFGLVAGTYTPLTLASLGHAAGGRMLTYIWAGAGLGMLRALFWPHAPRWLVTAPYVVLGWAATFEWRAFSTGLGGGRLALVLAGGLLYTVGALVYARKWPNPSPKVFGHHEVFHLFVIAAGICHFAVVASLG